MTIETESARIAQAQDIPVAFDPGCEYESSPVALGPEGATIVWRCGGPSCACAQGAQAQDARGGPQRLATAEEAGRWQAALSRLGVEVRP